MDMLEAYLDDCKSGRRDLRMAEMKEVLDSFGTVLWSHLQDEVDELSPDKMRQYWSIEEVKRLPM